MLHRDELLSLSDCINMNRAELRIFLIDSADWAGTVGPMDILYLASTRQSLPTNAVHRHHTQVLLVLLNAALDKHTCQSHN